MCTILMHSVVPSCKLAYVREHLSSKEIKRIHHVFPSCLEKFLCLDFSLSSNGVS